MNRLALILLRNLTKLPSAYYKLCRYARHPERYSEEEMWQHIQYTMQQAVAASNVDLQVFGKENIPIEGGFMLYGNHQGMFDVLAIAASCDRPLAIVYKKELKKIPFLEEIYRCTNSFAMAKHI